MFQMIDQLEPLITQEEMNALHNSTHYLWTKNNPEAHKAIYDRHNAKRAEKRGRQGMIALSGSLAILFAYAVCIGMGYLIGIQHKPGRYGRRR